MSDDKLFSVYVFEPEHGWREGSKQLTLNRAVPYAEDYRSNWAGSRVALVPDGMDPHPFLEFVLAIA